MHDGVIVDSCVFIDAFLGFRENHKCASELMRLLASKSIKTHMPSHAYFELAVATLIHFKREPAVLAEHQIVPSAMHSLNLEVVTLNNEYAQHLLDALSGGPLPDLKSQDMIYFCIARDRNLTLIPEDRKLRNAARNGGVRAFDTLEALALITSSAPPPAAE